MSVFPSSPTRVFPLFFELDHPCGSNCLSTFCVSTPNSKILTTYLLGLSLLLVISRHLVGFAVTRELGLLSLGLLPLLASVLFSWSCHLIDKYDKRALTLISPFNPLSQHLKCIHLSFSLLNCAAYIRLKFVLFWSLSDQHYIFL